MSVSYKSPLLRNCPRSDEAAHAPPRDDDACMRALSGSLTRRTSESRTAESKPDISPSSARIRARDSCRVASVVLRASSRRRCRAAQCSSVRTAAACNDASSAVRRSIFRDDADSRSEASLRASVSFASASDSSRRVRSSFSFVRMRFFSAVESSVCIAPCVASRSPVSPSIARCRSSHTRRASSNADWPFSSASSRALTRPSARSAAVRAACSAVSDSARSLCDERRRPSRSFARRAASRVACARSDSEASCARLASARASSRSAAARACSSLRATSSFAAVARRSRTPSARKAGSVAPPPLSRRICGQPNRDSTSATNPSSAVSMAALCAAVCSSVSAARSRTAASCSSAARARARAFSSSPVRRSDSSDASFRRRTVSCQRTSAACMILSLPARSSAQKRASSDA
eukprot:Opistho-2@30624